MTIHPTAFVHPSAQLHENIEVGPHAHISEGCVLGEGNVLMQGAILGPNTHVGTGNIFHFHTVIGHDPQFVGFDPKTKSGTRIGNNNQFREFSQVHRGLKDGLFTRIGNNNYIMTTSHVAHDCVLGDHNIIVNYSGISGHVEMEDRCFISGHVGVHQFCRIGTLSMIGGRTGISKDVPPYMIVKHYGMVLGINSVGLRRAGVSLEARMALKSAYKTLFRSGLALSRAIDVAREEWQGREMPKEVAHLLDFCAAKSRRGISRGPRNDSDIPADDGDEE